MKKKYTILFTIILSVLYLVDVALWISLPEELTLNFAVTGLALGLTLFYMYLVRDQLMVYTQSHHFKKIQDAIIFFILIFSLLSIVNYWSYKHPAQLDTSAIKLNSLSDQTKNILKDLKGPIVFKMFARKNESLPWLALLDFYRVENNSIQIEKIDIDVRPDLVGDYQINESATLVIEYNGKRQKVSERDELNITNGLIKISRNSDPVVYFVQGHGESDIQSADTEGSKMLFEAAKNSALDVRPINLLSTQEIPFDAKALVLWGPKTSLQASELAIIKRFLERKGNLMVAIDPDLNGDQHQELRALLRNYKIILRNDIVVDRKSFVNGSNGSIPLIDHYEHSIGMTKNFKGQIFFPLVSSLESIPDAVVPGVPGIVLSVVSASPFPDSWGETNLKELAAQTMSFTQGVDRPGPLSLVMTYENEVSRIAVFGNSTFVLNAYSKFGTNFSFFLNALSWTVGEDRLVSFNLPIIQSEPLFISAPQLGIIFYFSVLFVPLIMFFLAIVMYRRNRNK